MLRGYKTYITGGLVILGAIATYLTGDTTLQQSLELIVPAIMGIFIRHGVSTA